jgi:hypothetical protein
LNATAKHPDETVTYNFQGDYCKENEIFNGTNCTVAKQLNDIETITISPNISVFFTIKIEQPGTSKLTVKIVPFSEKILTNETRVYLRYEGTPSEDIYDISGYTNATYNSPRVGSWFVRITYVPSVNMIKTVIDEKFNVSIETPPCPENGVGYQCDIASVAVPLNITYGNIKAMEKVIFKFDANATFPLWISVTPQNSDQAMPDVYASVGQIPNEKIYDIKNCNRQDCTYANIIYLNDTNISPNNTWYIVITSPQNTSYAAWFSSPCLPGCSGDGGICQPEKGLCKCNADYSGLLCADYNPTGIQPQYIVLIIIASLVVASAIIGFIAWAYMQKKRQGYVAADGIGG